MLMTLLRLGRTAAWANQRRKQPSKNDGLRRAYRKMYDDAGLFHAPEHAEDLDFFLRMQRPRFVRRQYGGVDEVRHLYGLRFSYQDDTLVTASSLLGLKLPSDILIATVPRVRRYDHLEDEYQTHSVANFLTYGQPDGFLILASAQFVRIVEDFSAVISSTTPGPDGSAIYNIAPLEILDGLAGIVTNRWLAESTPPTYGHGYVPEAIWNTPGWQLLCTMANLSCWSFLIHHELAHIELGHVRPGTATEPADGALSEEQELAADAWAIGRCVEPFLDYMRAPVFRVEKPDGLAGFCIGTVLKFIGFLCALNVSGQSSLHTHPRPDARTSAAEALMALEAVRFGSADGLASALFGAASFFQQAIGERLPGVE
ncbi:hypothetical protein MQE23_25800 [Streptomyces sp. HP-A2021]|uniref:hypothetical protein n=1 Tax=Streptomyces sp. HP-A2021 TaxID=2927875 RepID=UPI001FAED5EB|nr:hypothetical protein [Streptomyces sp. HP-A2021]UOB12264.1 hypothetical protein MQE23_25800 [Streptomyces sp. HP-A2021]